MTDFEIREATPADVPDLIRLVRELAAYEREPEAATATPEPSSRRHSSPATVTPRHTPSWRCGRGRSSGWRLWFRSFSTWTGQAGIWLEDLFVEPEQRGSGIGAALLSRLAAICVEHGWTRLEWTVLDWNTPSIEFYRSRGATALDDWTTHRVDGPALRRLAGA